MAAREPERVRPPSVVDLAELEEALAAAHEVDERAEAARLVAEEALAAAERLRRRAAR